MKMSPAARLSLKAGIQKSGRFCAVNMPMISSFSVARQDLKYFSPWREQGQRSR